MADRISKSKLTVKAPFYFITKLLFCLKQLLFSKHVKEFYRCCHYVGSIRLAGVAQLAEQSTLDPKFAGSK
jgi:hypothetical protein